MWLWDDFNNAEFATWFSELFYKPELIGRIELPYYIQCAQNEDNLCEQVFPVVELANPHHPVDFFSKQAILCIRNTKTWEFNDLL